MSQPFCVDRIRLPGVKTQAEAAKRVQEKLSALGCIIVKDVIRNDGKREITFQKRGDHGV